MQIEEENIFFVAQDTHELKHFCIISLMRAGMLVMHVINPSAKDNKWSYKQMLKTSEMWLTLASFCIILNILTLGRLQIFESLFTPSLHHLCMRVCVWQWCWVNTNSGQDFINGQERKYRTSRSLRLVNDNLWSSENFSSVKRYDKCYLTPYITAQPEPVLCNQILLNFVTI